MIASSATNLRSMFGACTKTLLGPKGGDELICYWLERIKLVKIPIGILVVLFS